MNQATMGITANSLGVISERLSGNRASTIVSSEGDYEQFQPTKEQMAFNASQRRERWLNHMSRNRAVAQSLQFGS